MWQRFAKVLLENARTGTSILNIDESWIGESDFRRKAWCSPEEVNSTPKMLVRPRLSLIVAVDTEGRVYWCMMQTNTNERTMKLFLLHLFTLLDFERPGWRKSTIVQLDGAAYHRAKSIVDYLQDCQVSTIISAPYSYDGSTCELVFSLLKNGDLNPEGLGTSGSK